MSIRQLAPDVAAKIAAGEVVERPASVVKELIENSIDAGATQIRVDLNGGGLQLIRVTDNGSGISADELPLALARHATSKVAQIADLEHIRSLGFRGEALASIAAVADVTLLSRPRGSEQGAQIGALNGQLSAISVAAAAEGTTITVRNLFSAVPARLKFLKSRNTEISHCHHLLEQYALAYPELRFSVFSEGRQIFATPGDGQLASVLVEVYGLPIAEQMVPMSGNEHPENPEYPVVHGYVSRPACYKSTRQHISFFVNRRWVLSRMLTAAVEGAYHSLLLTGRHPIAVVNVQIDPSMLDVNVHPAKTEIRFLKERRVFAAILRAVRGALLEEPEMPQWQPDMGAGRSQETRLSAVITGEDEVQDGGTERPQEIVLTTITGEDPFPSDSPWITVAEEETGTKPPHLSRLWQSHIRSTATGVGQAQGTVPTGSGQAQGPVSAEGERLQGIVSMGSEQAQGTASAVSGILDSKRQSSSFVPSDVEAKQAQEVSRSPIPPKQVDSEYERQKDPSEQIHRLPLPLEAQSPISSEEAKGLVPQQPRRLPRLRVVGQVAQSYIVTEGEDGMYLIDQHAAHERILLERMVSSLKARTPISQLLLTPMTLSLSPGETDALAPVRARVRLTSRLRDATARQAVLSPSKRRDGSTFK